MSSLEDRERERRRDEDSGPCSVLANWNVMVLGLCAVAAILWIEWALRE